MPDFSIEEQFLGIVVGIDEAGRGPWAGPVAAAAVVINRAKVSSKLVSGLDDSKKLTAKKREELLSLLENDEAVKIGFALASVAEIDELNILKATMLAMERAVLALPFAPDVAIIDGNKAPKLFCQTKTIVKGDSKSVSIAAASIVAKVRRDKIMAELSLSFPNYAWDKNVGYGTKLHQEGLKRFGITPHHRKSYAPIKALL